MRLLRRKILLLAVCLAFLCVSGGYARGKQELILEGSWIYDALTAIALEEGRTDLSMQAPMSVAELDSLLSECDAERLSPAGKAWYDRIMEWRGEQDWALGFGLFSLGIAPVVSVEGYARTDTSIPYVYGYHERKPLLELPAMFLIGDWAAVNTTIRAGEFKTAAFQDDIFCNIPLTTAQVRDSFPHYAYASTGLQFAPGFGVSVRIANGELSVGRSLLGSVIWSGNATEIPNVNLGVYAPSIRYDLNVSQFETDRYYYSHRISFRFFKKVQFTFQESLLVHAPLELRYLNPLVIFHTYGTWNAYAEDTTCNVFAITASYTPVKYLRVYGMFVQDEWQFPGEASDDNPTPDAMGGQLGAELYVPAGPGYVHAWLEGSYAQPFLYMKSTKPATLMKTYTEQAIGTHEFFEWIGSPFGPDTVAGSLTVGYEVPGSWSASLGYLLAAKGEYSGTSVFEMSEWPFPKDGDTESKNFVAPHGTPEFESRILARADWRPFPWLSVSCAPTLVIIANRDHVQGKVACGFECALSASFDLFRLWVPKKRLVLD